ncbi:Rieske 2Fe-2S domain-containing protein [Chromobacterium sp. IIBBL 290-4]|uniref:aromatic ring-hydroxylating oxygenase subunit alpha n=1 Tax=Chromobacterium sp. IIBBL 290-4 TaxID=2953890 RepID=UPI0020B6463B|nr:aromatic ring-hydroxylating dioxygenase subunit alpha [Chromobacterium sp. IIBBL 290-4]UTH76459.1 aromatic ring-hydroxylating dioxygenase subunit alpha [Chromobacterium sp. IIBBL 290-4]
MSEQDSSACALQRPISYQQVLDADMGPIPADMRESHPLGAGEMHIDRHVYTSVDFHQREMDKMWSKVWQMACREEQIPEVGDLLVYELGNYSFIIVRTEDRSIKAFFNSCRHRGRKLCSEDTNIREIRCPSHGFSWSLDGELLHVPAKWDFEHMDKASRRLLEVKVAIWAGFVFINMDPASEPLEVYLEVLPTELEGNRYQSKYIAAHSQHILPANWKTVMESFMEGLHAAETHGHAWAHLSDILQYDIRPGARHVSRSFHAVGLPVGEDKPALSEQQIIDQFHRNVANGRAVGPAPRLVEGTTARRYMADVMRLQHKLKTGIDCDDPSDAEAIDVLQYSLFPNLIMFRGISLPPVLRFRPNKNDHNSCIFDLFYLVDVPKGGMRPAPAATIHMGPDDTYEAAGVLPDWLGYIYDQDMDNIKNMREGLKAVNDDPLVLSAYHESRIRHLHATLMSYLER